MINIQVSHERAAEPLILVGNAECMRGADRVSGILVKRESLNRCKRGRWARSRQARLVVYILKQHSAVLGTVHCCCCFMYHTNTTEALTKVAGFSF